MENEQAQSPRPRRRKKRRRRRRRNWPRTVLLLAFILAAGVGAYKCVVRPPDPAGPAAGPAASSAEDPLSPEERAKQAALAAHTKRKDGFYTVLVSGVDDGNGNNDTNILLALDSAGGRIYGVSVARDTKIELNGKSHKFNYTYNQGGLDLAAAVLSDQLGIPVDFTVEVSLRAFRQLVDAVDGVDFEVPIDMNYEDPYQNLSIHYQKGMQHLNGRQALEVVRFRAGYASQDIGRMNTQQDFLKALAKRVLQPGNVTKISEFSHIFQENVRTDLELGEIAWMGQEAFSIGVDQIEFSTLPGAWTSPYIYLDAGEVLTLVNEHLNPYVEPRRAEDLHIPAAG